MSGYDTEWSLKKLGDITDVKDSSRISNTLWISNGVPYLRSSDLSNDNIEGELFLSKRTYQEYSAKTGAPSRGDLLFTSGGKIGVTYYKEDDSEVYVQGGSILYAKTSESEHLDGRFLKFYFDTSILKKYIENASTGLTIKHFTLKPAKDTPIAIPDLEEQIKIGLFFKKLDDTIFLHQQELDALKQTKQGFLQKMFPKNGETEPSIRFDNSTKPWTLKKFEMICENFEYGLNASAKEFDGTNQYIRITDIDDESRTFSKSNVTSPDYDLSSAESYLLQYGDLLFARTGASVGKTYLYREGDGIVYFAGFLIRGKVRKIYDSEFVFQNTLTSSFKEFIKISSQRSGQPGINAKEIADYSILVPEYDEQTKIGNFFRKLDEVIKLKEKELEALKQTKKGFLQKIFV